MPNPLDLINVPEASDGTPKESPNADWADEINLAPERRPEGL